MTKKMGLRDFIAESNRIERIHREPSEAEIEAHRDFLWTPQVTIPALQKLVAVLQPDARLRDSFDVPGVQVGDHIAPPSSPKIRFDLAKILYMEDPWEQHCAYMTLHPFTDGNGRSGRALWLKQYSGEAPIGFLQAFYYKTLGKMDR